MLEEKRLAFLRQYMETICPSGCEEGASQLWRNRADTFADRTWVDTHGNSFAVVNEGGSPRVMLAGHTDEIGLMVSYIGDQGFLSFKPIGGWDRQVLPGQRVRILGRNADLGPILGVIGRMPIHLMKKKDREKVVEIEDLWIDIGVHDKEEAESIVSVGDAAVLDYGFEIFRNDIVVARAFDNRIGAFAILEAARLLPKMNLDAAVYAVATVQEEIGLRGATTSAFGIDPQVGIAVDVGFATDTPGMDKAKQSENYIKLGDGPLIARGPNINPRLFDLIVRNADEHNIPYQVVAWARGTGTDANAIQLTRAGVATGLISIPNRYMHSPCELVHMGDVENVAKLIAYTVECIDNKTNFIPGLFQVL